MHVEHEFAAKHSIVNYKGNRAIILFKGAAQTYFHKDHITSFISILPDPNNLLFVVKEDISEPIHVAELKALGIIHHAITNPLWKKIIIVDNILGMNRYLHQLQSQLIKWKGDAITLLHDEILPDMLIHHDSI